MQHVCMDTLILSKATLSTQTHECKAQTFNFTKFYYESYLNKVGFTMYALQEGIFLANSGFSLKEV